MNIVVTGAAGLLGAHLAASFSRKHVVTGVDRNDWWGDSDIRFHRADLTSENSVRSLLRDSSPEVLIHCAGMTDVDACERSPEVARVQHVEVPRLAVAATPPECLIIYISTDSIFSGDFQYWTEDHPPRPRNAYAASKLAGEQTVMQHPNFLIVRTNFYGWSSGRKKTSAEWLQGALCRREQITLFVDFFFTPIYVVHLVSRISAMIAKGLRGVYHVAGKDRVSKYEFGSVLARLMNVGMENVKKGALRDATLVAPRPSDISLSSARVSRLLGLSSPTCEEGVASFLVDQGQPLSRRFQAQ